MKAQSITTIFIATSLAVACGQKPEGIEAKKAELAAAKTQLAELKTQISTLEKEIQEEDPTFLSAAESAILVTSVPAEKSEFQHKIEVRGSVMSRTNITISSEAMGQLTSLNIKEGQQVNKGDIIATVDAENIEKTIDEVETQLAFATTVFEKRDRLWKKNIGTEIDYLQAKNAKETLEKQLETLNTQLEKTNIKAPHSGTIETVPVKTGEIVQPGSPIAFLVNDQDMYITTEVSEAFIGKFRRGDKVDVNIPSMNKSFSLQFPV